MDVVKPLSPVRSRQPRWVSWTPPVEGWHKLNTDGSLTLANNSASVGGLIQDDVYAPTIKLLLL